MLKSKLMSGEKIVGTMLRCTRNPATLYLAKKAGLDYIMFDCEHGNYNFETLHDLFVMGNAIGLAGFVRVPCGTKEYVSRVLDSGATGVMVPMIETAEQAKELVKYAKYQPIGERGYTGFCAHTNYEGGIHTEIMEQQNRKTITIAQIESKLAIENIEEIAEVPGLDALLIGPNDLSLSLGIPGDIMNPSELDAITKVAAACKKHGKAFGIHGKADMLQKFAEDLTLVMTLTDTDWILQGFESVRKVCDEL